MGTPFIERLGPTSELERYDRHRTHNEQDRRIPDAFKHSMSIREVVFVEEQGRLLENEFDEDDARSWHFIQYASVKSNEGPRDPQPVNSPDYIGARTIPIGTLRIVPFPHPPHPPVGGRYIGGKLQPSDAAAGAATTNGNPSANENSSANGNPSTNGNRSAYGAPNVHSRIDENDPPGDYLNGGETMSIDYHIRSLLMSTVPPMPARQTDFHDGIELYIKVGRVAVLPEYRHLNVADQLWSAAKQFLLENPTQFNPNIRGLGLDATSVGDPHQIPMWNGLVCLHAQQSAAEVYRGWGFRVDKAMGKFYEDNIPHVGMFQRLDIRHSFPR
ncbi:acetyltransferase [Xylaria palmicola]|nr:acetyltransferase [Xylaria palmicola]